MTRQTVVIFGATSAIAHAAARCYAADGAALHLVGRDAARLETLAQDLRARGAAAATFEAADLGCPERMQELVRGMWDRVGAVDVAILAHGVLGEQKAAQGDWAAAEAILRVNFLSHAAILGPLATAMERRGQGAIAVIGSVAGDRGRQSNYVYGSAKAALATYTDGLRNRLARAGVHVVTVKPGFTSTPMTAHLKQGPLYASADAVGRGLYRAVARRRDVAYLPGFWRLIMTVIKLVPERIFKRLSL